MNEQDTLNLLSRLERDHKALKELFSHEYGLKILKDGERFKIMAEIKELHDSKAILDENFKNKQLELEQKYAKAEDELKARLNSLTAQVAELDLRKANLVADVEVLKMNKLVMIDKHNELKAEKAMPKKVTNV